MESELIIFSEELLQQISVTLPVIYYAHYDKKTGEIFSISNEKNPKYEYSLELTGEIAEPFIDGQFKYSDYIIDYVANGEGKSVLSILSKFEHFNALRNNLFVQILDTKNIDTKDFIVEWDKINASWNFYISSHIKEMLTNKGITNTLVIFVSLESDLNQLIRTIYIDTSKLINGNKVIEPFVSYLENDINNIVVSSKLVFESYGLKIIHE